MGMPPQFVSKAAATHSSATNPGHSHGSSSVSPSGASLRLLACTPPLSFAFFVRAGSAYVFFFCLSQIALPLSFFPSLSELALHTFFFSACRKSPFPSPSFLLSFFLSNSNGTDARFCVSPLGGGGFNSLYSFAPTCLGAFLISLRAAPSRQPDTADLFHNAIHFGNFI